MENKTILTIGSYNIRIDIDIDGTDAWPFRKEAVSELITRYQFDVLGVQEVRKSQYSFLSKMKDFKLIGEGRTDDEETEFNPIMFNSKKVSLHDSGTFWLSETPNIISKYKDADCVRICTWGIFSPSDTSDTFVFMNTHLDHISGDARKYGVQAILEYIEEKKWNQPIIIVGDFNAGSEESWFQVIEKAGFQDARSVTKNGSYGPLGTCTGITFNHDLPLDMYDRIDYVFIKNNITSQEFRTITDTFDGKYPSDHLPLVATVVL